MKQYLTRLTCHWDSRCTRPDVFMKSSIWLGWHVIEIRGVQGPMFLWKAVLDSANMSLRFAVYKAQCFYEKQYWTRLTCHRDSRCTRPDVFMKSSIWLGWHVIEIRGVQGPMFLWKAVFDLANMSLRFAVYLARCFIKNSIWLGRHVIEIRGVQGPMFLWKANLTPPTYHWDTQCTWLDVFMKSSI